VEPGEDFITRLWSDYSLKIEKAKAREAQGRLSVFCPQPTTKIGKFPVVPLTLERYSILQIPEFWEDPDPRIPILRFLWVMSPGFDPNPERATEFILEHISDDLDGYDESIRDLFDHSFNYAPKVGGKKKTTGASDWISHIIDLFASEYGWTDEKILKTPLDRIFVYLQRIHARRSDKPIKFSTEADRLQQEFMDIVNSKVGKN